MITTALTHKKEAPERNQHWGGDPKRVWSDSNRQPSHGFQSMPAEFKGNTGLGPTCVEVMLTANLRLLFTLKVRPVDELHHPLTASSPRLPAWLLDWISSSSPPRRSALKQPLRTQQDNRTTVQQNRERERLQRCACERVQAWSALTAFGSRVCRVCVFCGSQQSRGTSAHVGPGLLPRHGLAGCDLPEAPGEPFL